MDINSVTTFLWWVQTYFEFHDELQNGEYLWEGPVKSKVCSDLSPLNLPGVSYKKRWTQAEVIEMFRLCTSHL